MKILASITSENNPSGLAKSLKWAARGGFDLKIFIFDVGKLENYKKVIEQANYNHYLSLTYEDIVFQKNAENYARSNKYDLLLTIPPELTSWLNIKYTNETLIDKSVIQYAIDVGKARHTLAKNPEKQFIEFDNGARLTRL